MQHGKQYTKLDAIYSRKLTHQATAKMTLSITSTVSVVQLAFFIPFLFVSGWMIAKHGFRSQGGAWRYITILSLLRIIGSGCEIAGEASPSKSLRTVVLICNSIGLAPLLLQCTGLVTRA